MDIKKRIIEVEYQFPDTREGIDAITTLRHRMNASNLYFQTPHDNRQAIRLQDAESIEFVENFLKTEL